MNGLAAQGVNSGGGIAYRPDIDGLRAIAVLAVVGFHAFPGHFPGGFLGVDIFFVISGYLITSLLLREREASGAIDIGQFYIRRIRRLFPALLVVIFATLAAGYALLFAHEFARLARHAWASLFFVENILLATESGYFDVDAYDKPLLHFWSLAVEEQFYLVWPLLLALFARNTRQVGLLIGFAVAASLFVTFAGILDGAWHFYSPATRVWELGAGAGLGWWAARRGDTAAHIQPVLGALLALFALGGIAAAVLFGSENWHHPGLLTMVPVLATVLLIALGGETAVNRRLLAWRPAVAIGLISYPLYLWHWPLLSYLAIVAQEERGPTLIRLAMVALAFILATATYLLLERPVRRRYKAQSSVRLLLLAAVLVAASALAMLLLRPANSDPVAAVAEDQLEGAFWRYTKNDICEKQYGTDYRHFCMASGAGQPSILLLGDSFANHLYAGFAHDPRTRDKTMLSFGSCELSGLLATEGRNCTEQLALARRYGDDALIVLGGFWPDFDQSGELIPPPGATPDKGQVLPDINTYGRALGERVSAIAAMSSHVILVGPHPFLPHDMSECYPRPLRPVRKECSIDRSEYVARSGPTRNILRKIAAEHANVHYFDPSDVFCDAATCAWKDRHGYPLIRDNAHFSVLGSRMVVGRMVDLMAQKNLPLP